MSVVNKYTLNEIPVIEIDNVLNKHIYDYNEKFDNFDCWCIIQNGYFCEKINLIRKFVPDIIKIQEEIIRRNKCGQDDLVYMKIIFITDLKSATYNHYFFNLPNPMIERRICRIFESNPNLIKTLDHMPEAYKKHIIIKHWGIHNEYGEMAYGLVPYNWMDLEPKM